ncbi:MAG: type II 3-dehydroquinate dehydratase [Pseudomonadota bacterium]|nr:type II 3-dehydroquinate dehydratase [Pseudomonadota bacterium]
MMKILVINGPNLNLLGKRESSIYGNESLDDIISGLENICAEKNASLLTFQSNAEHEIVEKIHSCQNKKVDWMIINPGAFTHTSIAIRDALIGVGVPFYEVHISNIFAREEFRHKSYFSDIAQGVICGFGTSGYESALLKILDKN